MKLKFAILTFAILVGINTSAQKKPTKGKAKTTTGTKTTTNASAKANASKIIQFGNTVIELGNSYSESLNNYQSLLKNADGTMEQVTKNPNLTPHYVNCNVVSVQARQLTAYTSASKMVNDFPEKADIMRHVAEGENYAKSIGTWCAALSTYIANKEFKNDNQYTQYKSMRDSIDYYLAKTSASWRAASQKASDAGNRAELILLEGSPIASFVIPMKTDLIALESILKMFNTEKPDTQAIKSALAEAKASIEKNKDISTKDVSKLRDIYYKDVYQTFYRQCASVAKSLETVANRFEEKNLDMDNINSWFGSASGDYQKVIEEYNKFVSQ